MVWKGTMSRLDADRERMETKEALKEYAKEIRENLNLRLFCESGCDISLWEMILPPGEVLWVEEVVFTGVTYPGKNRPGKRFKGIRKLFRKIKNIILKIF